MDDALARHDTILSENGDPVDCTFLEVNPAFERVFGLEAAGVVGHRVSEVWGSAGRQPCG